MKYEIVLKGEAPRLGSSLTVTGEEQRRMNSIVANEMMCTKAKGGYDVAQLMQLEHGM